MNDQKLTIRGVNIHDFSVRVLPELLDNRNSLENRILKLITPAYFRIGTIDLDILKMLSEKISLSIKSKEPIRFIIATGWGKNYHAISAPHINYAEYFHLKFLFDTLARISAIYDHGVVIDFAVDSQAVKIINNFKSSDLLVYENEFTQLIDYINKIVRDTKYSFKMNLRKSEEWYPNDNKLESEIFEEVERIEKDTEKVNSLSKTYLHHAINNLVRLKDEPEESFIERAKRSILIHSAWLSVDYKHRSEYLEGGTHIPVIHRKGIPYTYPIKNLPGSLIQYWKGIGMVRLSNKKEPYVDIVSPNQYNELNIAITKVYNPTEIKVLDQIPILS